MDRSIQDFRGTTTEIKSCRNRIPDLPEPLISHILSLMPTKDAVRTSVLSKDWELKWTSLHVVDIDDKVSDRQKNRPSFSREDATAVIVSFVERLLLLSNDISCFRLRLIERWNYQPSQIVDWICDLSMGKLESLIVECDLTSVSLPRNLLRNTSLKNLELKSTYACGLLKVPGRMYFPNLKNLKLYQVWIINQLSYCTDTLTLSFPVLETLELDECPLRGVQMVEVELQAPQLTSFRRTNEYPTGPVNININSTRLAEFKFLGSARERYVLVGQHVISTNLSYNDRECAPKETGIQARVLLNQFSNLKELEISSFCTWAFEESTGVSFSVFHHLERLVVSWSCNGFHVKGLLELLDKTPFLKFLRLDGELSDFDYNVVEHVPLCFKDHLEEIKYTDFSANRRQLALLEFILESVRALKKFHVIWKHHLYKIGKGLEEIPEPYLSAFSAYRTKLRFLAAQEDT